MSLLIGCSYSEPISRIQWQSDAAIGYRFVCKDAQQSDSIGESGTAMPIDEPTNRLCKLWAVGSAQHIPRVATTNQRQTHLYYRT